MSVRWINKKTKVNLPFLSRSRIAGINLFTVKSQFIVNGTGKSVGELCKVACNDLTELSLMYIQKWGFNMNVSLLYISTSIQIAIG